MSQTPQQQGTTLEVLAPYLPYGLEVEVGINDGERERTQLHSLTQDGYPRIRTYGHEKAASFEDMLPVLRPFSQLCEPLPDGTVPVCRLAQMMFDGMVGDGGKLEAGVDHFGHVVVSESGGRVLSISPDWEIFAEDGLRAGLAEYQQLLKWHFAVGLSPEQFIAK